MSSLALLFTLCFRLLRRRPFMGLGLAALACLPPAALKLALDLEMPGSILTDLAWLPVFTVCQVKMAQLMGAEASRALPELPLWPALRDTLAAWLLAGLRFTVATLA